MRIQTESRSLPTELTAEELAKESDRLAGAVKEVEKQEEHIAEQKGLWAEKKKAMEGYLAHLKEEMGALATVVDSGVADRDVECSWLYALRQGFAFLVRDDTGELVHHRKLGDAERQENLLEVLREPTAEQLETWTASLGLVMDPQVELLLGEAGAAAPAYYRRLSIPGEHGPEQIVGLFTEADHRPSSLAGVYLDAGDADLVPEDLDYEDDPTTLGIYRAALESVLEGKQLEARRAARGESGDDEPLAPTPIGRGRKGKA